MLFGSSSFVDVDADADADADIFFVVSASITVFWNADKFNPMSMGDIIETSITSEKRNFLNIGVVL